MKQENVYFKVEPKIVQADSEATIKIVPLYDHCKFVDLAEYEVTYVPIEQFTRKTTFAFKPKYNVKLVEGALYITEFFEGEQEHLLKIEEIFNGIRKYIGEFRIYSLENDLFSKRPYKGDMHMHSYHSDGQESPAFVAASCRKIGLDFMAITDHELYHPSIEAQQAFTEVELDLKIFRGEEVHAPDNFVHIINFGGSFSVNELYKNHEEKYRKEVDEISNGIVDFPLGTNKYDYASSLWVYNKIHEGGGMSLFCHPYWICGDSYNHSTILSSYMFEKQPFDAYELIGGYHLDEVDSNKLQVARYNEERANGRKIPIVGVSDAHGCENGNLFGWYYTIVFSSSLKLQDLITSVIDLNSVAVEALPGETVRVYGPFRLVKYALFLLREVFPAHDEMCLDEGKLMLKYVAGDTTVKNRLHELKGQTQKLLNQCWSKV